MTQTSDFLDVFVDCVLEQNSKDFDEIMLKLIAEEMKHFDIYANFITIDLRNEPKKKRAKHPIITIDDKV